MREHRIWYAVMAAAAVIVYIVADRREPLIFLCVLIGMPVLSVGMQLFAMRQIVLECGVKGSCLVTQEVPVCFILHRRSKRPLGAVRIEVRFENILYREEKNCLIDLQPCEKRDMVFEYPFYAENCGSMKITADHMYCYDMMGLFRIKRRADIDEEILVYPKEIKLNVELSHRLERKGIGNMYNQDKKGQDVSEVAALRDYLPGDLLHSIHWKLSGKLDHLVVKEFGNPSDYSTLILYEMAKSCGDRKITNQCNDAVATLTVFLSHSMMEMNLEHNVGRVIGGDFQTVPVYSIHTHEDMTLNLLCSPVVEETHEGDAAYSFMKGNMRSEYTKIVYITSLYDEGSLRQLARETDLTVISVQQGRELGYAMSAGYSVISVDADRYMENVHSIVI